MTQWPSFADSLPQDPVFGAIVDLEKVDGIDRLASLYDRNRPDLIEARPTPSIPKIIHQIWLGSPVPKKLRRYSDSWRKHHPDWEFRIWTDREVEQFEFETRDLFESAECWGQKSDLLRVEILNRMGGVYVDFDYLSYKPIDQLVERYDFFTTLKYIFTAYLGWPAVWPAPIVACNSLMGARAGHP
ncbi:MAG: glycosyltransferase family 32 protein, partial [Gammaproteobacteria bacterium]